MCHAEENQNINQISEDIFIHGRNNCNFNFSLSPIKQIGFGIYDDQKASLTGIIENPDFGILLKKTFMRTLTMKYRDLINSKASKIYRVLRGDPTQREMETVLKYHDDEWVKYLGVDKQAFRISTESIPKVIDIKPTNVVRPQRQA